MRGTIKKEEIHFVSEYQQVKTLLQANIPPTFKHSKPEKKPKHVSMNYYTIDRELL